MTNENLKTFLNNLGIEIVDENDNGLPVGSDGKRYWVDRLTRPGSSRVRWAKDASHDEGEHSCPTHGVLLIRKGK